MTFHCFKILGKVSLLTRAGLARTKPGRKADKGRVNMAAEVNIFEEMDPIFVAEN